MVVYSQEEFQKKFGKKLKMYRKLANLTQEQLAEKCDCSGQTISGAETGYSFPSSKILFKLPGVLNIPLFYLFNFGEDKNLYDAEMTSQVSSLFNGLDDTQKVVIIKVMTELCAANKN